MTDNKNLNKYIYLSSNKKIVNPLYLPEKSNIFSYYGDINNIDFEYQTNNYKNIVNSLKPFNINLKNIWFAKFTNSANQVRSHFLAKSEDERVFWHKYESMAPGGCQNKIYIDGKQIYLSQWLQGFSDEDRKKIINNQ